MEYSLEKDIKSVPKEEDREKLMFIYNVMKDKIRRLKKANLRETVEYFSK